MSARDFPTAPDAERTVEDETRQAVRPPRRGFRSASPAERAGFGMLTSISATIAIARAINYAREQSRSAPAARSLGRRIGYRATRRNELRVHHAVPGIAIGLVTGATAILTREDGRAAWLSLPFGIGTGLTLDQIALLFERDNPYWGSEGIALTEAAVAALAASGIAARVHRRGVRAG